MNTIVVLLQTVSHYFITLNLLTMDQQVKNPKLKNWLKKVGVWGFLFFLAKGIVWLLVGYFALR